ncbi:hypothetical protein C8R44DRAFT_353368 [Mycena epipterygia]|nr:hypothetical protein C8R44DRAFT_353368 [Mycena epipterygia]
MVLTRRAHKAISRWLPNEVLTEIIEAFPNLADRASLCRVSKLFHALCLPILYRVVHLDVNLHSAVTFSSSLKENSTRADAIRHLIVTSTTGPRLPDSVVARISMLTELLKLMQKLEHLSINPVVWYGPEGPSHDYRPVILQSTFSGLLSCVIPMIEGFVVDLEDPHIDLLGSFLSRHPKLTRIHVRGQLLRAPSARISLENLQYYRGPGILLPSLDVGIGLREARIEWSSSEIDDLENIIVSLNSLTRHDIPFTFCTEDCDDDVDALQIMDSISRNIPHTKTLRLACLVYFSYYTHEEIANTSRHIRECLPRFTGLVYLGMEGHWPLKNEAESQIEVKAWGDVCPTLEACSLDDGAWRKVNGVWEQYSIEDFRVLAGITWVS